MNTTTVRCIMEIGDLTGGPRKDDVVVILRIRGRLYEYGWEGFKAVYHMLAPHEIEIVDIDSTDKIRARYDIPEHVPEFDADQVEHLGWWSVGNCFMFRDKAVTKTSFVVHPWEDVSLKLHEVRERFLRN